MSRDFVAGELLLIDKPLQWTSFDVVAKLRHAIRKSLGLKKFKIGHAGTLDPLATGLLIICTGKKTKEINSFMGLEKEYTGTIRLGATTPSYDLETAINQEYTLDGIDFAKVQEAAKSLTGSVHQTPPLFSAKKVDGTRAYEHARKGNDVTLAKALVQIDVFEITEGNWPEVNFRVVCGKGTYIRSLAHDLGHVLGCGGHLTSLRRTRIGPYSAAESLDPLLLAEEINPGASYRKLEENAPSRFGGKY